MRPFTVSEHVRWGDVDPAGIIRYDAYLRFFELGESEFFRALGIKYRDLFTRFHIGLPRRVMHTEFISPPTLDETLEVCVYVSGIGASSMTLNFDIYGEGGVTRAQGYLVVVCVARDQMVKRAWPPEFLELVTPYKMSPAIARAGRGHP